MLPSDCHSRVDRDPSPHLIAISFIIHDKAHCGKEEEGETSEFIELWKHGIWIPF